MRPFISYLREETESDQEGEKLKHIEHLEDHPINDGAKGYEHAIGALEQTKNHIIMGANDSSLTMKHDGSPSIVYGHHPETGKFFVASKSAFNKNPKINYTPADVEKNHGHAPGLVRKLKDALTHLPKITPKEGVYQGDVLFSGNDKTVQNGRVHFTPNTITYSDDMKGEGPKIKRAKFGIYNHTQYVGKTGKSMTANYSPDMSNFKEHPDVYHRMPGHDTSKVKLTPAAEAEYNAHLASADKIHNAHGSYMYDALHNPGNLGSLRDHVKTYINSTVDTQEKPTVKGLQKHIENKYVKQIDKVKTDAAKKKYQDELTSHIKHTNLHNQNIQRTFDVHQHLQHAKNVLVHTLAQYTGGLTHEVKGQPVKPEGFVVNHEGQLSKLNDRNEFNRLNRLARQR